MAHEEGLGVRDGIGAEAERARRFEAHLSILLVNVDGLGVVNAKLGKEAGDFVLDEIAQLIRRQTRSIDVVGRWDREDFIVLSVDKNAFGSVVMAEKLRRVIADHLFDWKGRQVRVTVSIGVSRGVPSDESQIDSLIDAARNAVLRAKTAGRNRIEYAGSDGELSIQTSP
jgi:diguanylate cyclase (GGDEF)-like protein